MWKRRSWALFVHLSRIYRGASPRRLTCTDFPVNDLVVDAAAEKVLLLFHTKLQRWLQPGGHLDGDAVAIMMADLSDSPDDLVAYYRLLQAGYDCAFGPGRGGVSHGRG